MEPMSKPKDHDLRNVTVFVAAMASLGLANSTLAAEPTQPKLIVAISVDQFSANLFDEWRGQFTGGLKRLSSGVVYTSGYQTHAATETCPGHSTLLTGKHPNKTGIVANAYHDPATGKVVYCVNDPSVVIANDPKVPPVGPARLVATTFGDWMKAANPASRVVAISAKDRAAITMAGHHPDGVYWLVEGFGFTTYMAPGGDAAKALAPVAGYNASIAKLWTTKPQWTYAHPDCKAKAASWSVGGKTWESKLPPENWGVSDDPKVIKQNVGSSPMADEMTGQAARHLIKQFDLGKGPAPDLLAISFSATDFVGHRYGTRGPEMCEQMHRLDETIGRILSDLDRRKVPYLVVLSADHGGSDFTERMQVQGFPNAKRVNSGQVLGRVNAALMAELGLAKAPLMGSIEESDVVGVSEADKARVTATAVRVLAAQPEVTAVFTREQLLETKVRPGVPPDELSVQERFALGAYAGRSPEILVALNPESTLAAAAPGVLLASHGSVWDYDRRVPMLFWWPGAGGESRFLPVETVDIGPTLAGAIGIAPPSDVDGRCLTMPASSGVVCSR